ncbi:oxysterol-binding protein-related protein 8-like isoform X3 [Portunus trituberculatus]|uniref:oxysterol-binding protein-related protein 8-like isoform X3 n=1 Tax=Portunus trituberculatus TaxID=210409 RepID=UPI001E1D02B4|nr:oxysterol-binding protein-related protein 8-like isoform X3 [Portunus trituberculatus]
MEFPKSPERDTIVPVISVDGGTPAEGSDVSGANTPRSERPAARKSSLAVLLPRLPGHHGSSDSLNHSPQSSPGYDGTSEASTIRLPDTPHQRSLPLSRKESYKDQRKKYRREKKRVARELLSTLKDPAVVVLADWLKIRGSLKGWTKLWCVLKPGMLLLYKSAKVKSSHWVGTVLLNTCELIERPSKKDGFCFKLFHPLEQSIWATKGPEGETMGAVVQPLPSSHLIFRAPSQAAGKCWMDALELAVRCSSILIRSMTSSSKSDNNTLTSSTLTANKWNESDYEKHFKDQDISDDSSQGGLSPENSPLITPQSSWRECVIQLTGVSSLEGTPTHRPLAHLGIQRDPSPTPYYRRLAAAIHMADQELKGEVPSRRQSLTPDDASITDCSHTNTPDLKGNRKKNFFKLSPRIILKTPKKAKNDLDDASHTDDNEYHRESGHFSGAEPLSGSESESEDGSHKGDERHEEEEEEEEEEEYVDDLTPIETAYVSNKEGEMGEAGEQVEELEEENKSLIWFLLKQVRPGMDLSKVVLPTFILEPRSFLDKLSDYYYHADLLSKAVQEDDPYTRMKEVVRWYLSGFYKKPKGLKKPYNPILGETFRCYWRHPNGSRTFYVAEQVSHHPPVSALYVTNRQEGFSVSATVLAKSKFYGNSTSAILDGNVQLSLLPRGEDYIMNMPYAHCKGILMGTLTMELGGKVTVECEKTGYKTELEFKLRPFLSGYDSNNMVSGKLKLGKDTLATLEGHWDGKITLTDKRTGEEELLWHATQEVKSQRLQRFTVTMEQQGAFESERLWQLVSAAIKSDDQTAATEEKTILEEAQRSAANERKVKCEEWVPTYFAQDLVRGVYVYKHSDLRPWDPRTDLFQYEHNYVIATKTRHKAPMIRTASIVSVDPKCDVNVVRVAGVEGVPRLRGVFERPDAEETSSGDHDDLQDVTDHTVGNSSVGSAPSRPSRQTINVTPSLLDTLNKVSVSQDLLVVEVKSMKQELEALTLRISSMATRQQKQHLERLDSGLFSMQSLSSILVALVMYSFIKWLTERFWL